MTPRAGTILHNPDPGIKMGQILMPAAGKIGGEMAGSTLDFEVLNVS
jgi:hypothetical protein